MAVDKLVDSAHLDADLSSVANAIRAKSGGSASLAFPAGFVSEIQAIPTGGGYTADDFFDPALPDVDITINAQITSSNKNRWIYWCAYRTGLKSVTLSNAEYLPQYFFNNSALTDLVAPEVTFADASSLYITKLKYIVLPKLAGCGRYALSPGNTLVGADLGGIPDSGFGQNAFSYCSNMDVLILRAAAVWRLDNINAFSNTPFASGKAGGTLYVPQTLISEYQAATNWSTILGYANNSIQAIEGSIYETQYADGTPIPTT